jgi:hypothetical protein
MEQWVTSAVSALALAVSVTTAYLTLFRRGSIRMTNPTVVFFGPDGRSARERPVSNKVFLRTLLYATSKRGQIVENMFVKLFRGEVSQTFNIWVYGDQQLARGSGLFVGETGVACNHHFLLASEGTDFQFIAGEYRLEVHAVVAGDSAPRKLTTIQLLLTAEFASKLEDPSAGLYFDWGPDSLRYHPHIDRKPESMIPPGLFDAISAMRSSPGELERSTNRPLTQSS